MNKLSVALFIIFFQSASFCSEINYSFNLSNEIRNLLINDLETLKTLNLKSETKSELNRILKIKELEAFEVSEWINKRVSFIVEEDFNISGDDVFSKDEFSNVSSSVLMTNYGAAIYVAAKNQDVQAGFYFINQDNEKKDIMITSPRVGLLKVGPGLFDPTIMISPDKTSHSNILNRLSVIAHEARHSDGNDSSLGFRHQKCPTGHYLKDRMACDVATNGAYAVGSHLLKELTRVCDTKCATYEKQMLMMIVLDNASRIIKTDKLNDWDETPVGAR